MNVQVAFTSDIANKLLKTAERVRGGRATSLCWRHVPVSRLWDAGSSRRLEPDPAKAPVVQRIFSECLSGIGGFAIAKRLNADPVLPPSATDRQPNRHRHRPYVVRVAERPGCMASVVFKSLSTSRSRIDRAAQQIEKLVTLGFGQPGQAPALISTTARPCRSSTHAPRRPHTSHLCRRAAARGEPHHLGTMISAMSLDLLRSAGLPVSMAWCSYEAATARPVAVTCPRCHCPA